MSVLTTRFLPALGLSLLVSCGDAPRLPRRPPTAHCTGVFEVNGLGLPASIGCPREQPQAIYCLSLDVAAAALCPDLCTGNCVTSGAVPIFGQALSGDLQFVSANPASASPNSILLYSLSVGDQDDQGHVQLTLTFPRLCQDLTPATAKIFSENGVDFSIYGGAYSFGSLYEYAITGTVTSRLADHSVNAVEVEARILYHDSTGVISEVHRGTLARAVSCQ